MLEWTHDQTTCPSSRAAGPSYKGCTGDTDCDSFPTTQDRIAMARAAYEAYAEADGTLLPDFVLDVLLMLEKFNGPALPDLVKYARRCHAEGGREYGDDLSALSRFALGCRL